MGWLKKGQEAHEELEKEEQKAELKQKSNVRRFWLPDGKDTSITFLDGDLDEDGLLNIPMYREHQVKMNGDWRNYFVCLATKDTPCPVCLDENEPYLAGVMTVIDHSEYKGKDGKHYKDQVRLFVAKRQTINLLQMHATKRDGLTGCTFDVARTGNMAPGVGSFFDYTEKTPLKKILAKYEVDGPLDYEEVLPYFTAEDLGKLGFGSGVGSEKSGGGDSGGSGKNYEKEM